jgi:hypothetical protein
MKVIRVESIDGMILFGKEEEMMNPPNGLAFRCKFVMRGNFLRELIEFNEQLLQVATTHKVEDKNDYYFYLTGTVAPDTGMAMGYEYAVVNPSGVVILYLNSDLINSFQVILKE